MGVLVLDEKDLHLNVRIGVLENYKPSAEHKKLQKKLDDIRSKKKALDEHYLQVLNDEIMPALSEIKVGIRDINEARYPELRVKREATEAVSGTDRKPKKSTKQRKK